MLEPGEIKKKQELKEWLLINMGQGKKALKKV